MAWTLNDSTPVELGQTFSAPATPWTNAYWGGPTTMDFATSANVTVTPGTATLALATFAPAVSTPVLVTPGVAGLTLSSFAPGITVGLTVTPGVAALALSTFVPTVSTPRLVTPGVINLTLTAFAPTITATANVLATPTTLALGLGLFAPIVTATGVQPQETALPAGDMAPLPYRRVPVTRPEDSPRTKIQPPESAPEIVVVTSATSEAAALALYGAGEIELDALATLLAA